MTSSLICVLPLTPRSVKRLANSYGLLTALRQTQRRADHTDVPNPAASPTTSATSYRPYRAGLVLLAALVAFPALGPHLCQRLHRQAVKDPDATWENFVNELKPPPGDGREADDVTGGHERGDMSPTRARQWADLRTALLAITAEAAAQGLHLPVHLGAWRPWVIPTARLSFPAGQIVKSLTLESTGEGRNG